ncbi:hypothetical protein [Nonomuraea harbinensis]|uniref:DUF3800 domain-containing protein n=1 Tax=Nonomuraea harbinensis TaxID=1286938 RepID=A0ABW1BQG1_9ACTN|nr:hypothetical protein [Nonomuraea harbinensis]
MNPPFSAYVDESMRLSHGLYLMAAVLVPPAQADFHRAALRGLLLRRQRRLHWRDENAKRRTLIIETVAGLRPSALVVVGTGLEARRQERARRKCMEHLLWELGRRPVTEIFFESRGPWLDAADRKLIDILRTRHAISPRLRALWVPAVEEPLTWLPDVVAGAASLAASGEAELWEGLGTGAEMVFVAAG